MDGVDWLLPVVSYSCLRPCAVRPPLLKVEAHTCDELIAPTHRYAFLIVKRDPNRPGEVPHETFIAFGEGGSLSLVHQLNGPESRMWWLP